MKIDFNKPTIEREHPIAKELGSGTQKIWRFPNDFGASVVQFQTGSGTFGSYTNNWGEWELAVLKITGDNEDDWRLCYGTRITNDVIGHLTEEEVVKILKRIKRLKKK